MRGGRVAPLSLLDPFGHVISRVLLILGIWIDARNEQQTPEIGKRVEDGRFFRSSK